MDYRKAYNEILAIHTLHLLCDKSIYNLLNSKRQIKFERAF